MFNSKFVIYRYAYTALFSRQDMVDVPAPATVSSGSSEQDVYIWTLMPSFLTSKNFNFQE